MPISPSTGPLTAARLLEADAFVFVAPQFAYERSGTFQVDSGSGFFSASAELAALAGGGFAAAWYSANGLRAQVFNADGVARGLAFTVSTSRGDIAALTGGGFIITTSSGGFIRTFQYDSQGASVGAAIDIAASPSGLSTIATAGLPGNAFVVVWTSTGGEIMAQRVSAAGALVGGAVTVNSVTAGAQTEPSVAALANGGYVVSWTSDGEINSQRFTADGFATGGQIVVNTTAVGDQSAPQVAGLVGGGHVVVWLSEDGTGERVHVQRYDASGAKVGGELRADTFTGGKETPTVEALPDGGFFVGWTSINQNPSTAPGPTDPAGVFRDVYGRRFDADGVAAGSEIRLNLSTGQDQLDPSIAVMPDGELITSWLHVAMRGNSVASTLTPVSVDALTAGADTLTASPNARLVGTLGADLAAGDSLVGGAAIDRIQLIAPGVLDLTAPAAFTGFEVVAGSEGDDRFIVSNARLAGVTHLFGRSGSDTVEMSASGSLDLTGITLTGLERLQGSAGDDHIVLRVTNHANPNTPRGLAGVGDLAAIDGGAGQDVVEFINSSNYAPILNQWDWTGVEVIRGSAADDVFLLRDIAGLSYQTAADLLAQTVIEGGDGVDTLQFSVVNTGFTVALTPTSVENITGWWYDDHFTGNAAANEFKGSLGDDWLDGGLGDDRLHGESNDDQLLGGGGDDILDGDDGEDILYGMSGNDILYDGDETSVYDGDEAVNRDFLFGGAGNDVYHLTSMATGPLDLVYEGGANPDVAGGAGDVDVILSYGDFWRDFYSVGEVLYIERDTGAQMVGGTNNQTIYGGAGGDVILAYGGSNRLDGGGGTDTIGLGLYDLAESFDGVNTVVLKPGSGMDYVYGFESGVDKIDLTGFNFGITGAQVLAQAVNVDNAGTANDYAYFYLTSAGGVDNYVVFMGLLSSQLQASDFVT